MIEKDPQRMNLFNRLFAIPNNWRNVLYVHTPFCKQKCFYCVYSSKSADNAEEMDNFYQNVLPRQFERMTPALEAAPFHEVYFGGGTPTIAEPETLERIYGGIPNFAAIPFKAGEASPYTITDRHIDLFARYGFNYVSLGVQTLDQRIVTAQNRLSVPRRRLEEICRALEQAGIVSNIDLIFFLDTGELKDIAYSLQDLLSVLGQIRPVSITLHFNYMIKRTKEKRAAMIRLLGEMLQRFPDYTCVNSLLDLEDAQLDMTAASEYRLMRESRDMNFYMIPKIPQSHAYGYNMLALGAYGDFKPRYNYFYLFDFMDKYVYRQMMLKYKDIILKHNHIRRNLGLPPQPMVEEHDFFKETSHRERFATVMREAGLPVYEFLPEDQ